MNPTRLLIATTTFSEKSHATEMARLVIREKAAACAQVDGPIESHYCWDNQICQDSEWRLTMKTTISAISRLQELVLGAHPYDQPQWLVTSVVGTTAEYESWVEQAVNQTGTR